MSQSHTFNVLSLLESNKVVQLLSYSLVVALLIVLVNSFSVLPGIGNYYLGGALVTTGSIVMVYFLLNVEKSSLELLGLHWRQKLLHHSVMGLGIGLLVMAIIFGVLLWLSNVSYLPLQDTSVAKFLSISIPILFVLALMEEVIFRGYLLFKLKSMVGTRLAIYITAIVFGFYHGLVIQSLTGPAVWGILFALMALWSKGLALPTLFHFALNWMQAVFDLKQKYTPGLFEFVLIESSSKIDVNHLGLIIQAIMFFIAVVLVEIYCRKEARLMLKGRS
ncbi:MAG: CPBP family intramembrane metalloprotease [Gammaproteobacteria bacterium]|nr:CPBP family intramembrane metalloprotease [Gammaproteobacteria bacterium]